MGHKLLLFKDFRSSQPKGTGNQVKNFQKGSRINLFINMQKSRGGGPGGWNWSNPCLSREVKLIVDF